MRRSRSAGSETLKPCEKRVFVCMFWITCLKMGMFRSKDLYNPKKKGFAFLHFRALCFILFFYFCVCVD